MSERLLPYNIEAECGVLGSIIIDPEAVVQVADFLHPEDFYRDAHRTIYEVVLQFYERSEPADFITICDELERTNKLSAVGGASSITSLINAVPTSGNVVYYARIVERTSILRRLIHAAGEIAATAYEDGASAEEALERAEQLIYHISQDGARTDFVSAADIIRDLFAQLEESSGDGSLPGSVETGFDQLDFYTGNLQPTDLIVAAGRPGSGKSSIAASIIYHLITKTDMSCGLFSLEMSKQQVIQRLVSMSSGVPAQRLRTHQIYDGEWERVVAAMDQFSTRRLHIDDTAGIDIMTLRSRARRLRSEGNLDILFVDYIQLVHGTAETRNARTGNRVQELDEVAVGLKNLAKELNIPVFALAQLSRAVESRAIKIPQMSDLRESGAIENTADIVMFIYRDEMYNPNTYRAGIADVILAKHRNGPTGEVALGFAKTTTRFYNLPEEAQPISLSQFYSKRDN